MLGSCAAQHNRNKRLRVTDSWLDLQALTDYKTPVKRRWLWVLLTLLFLIDGALSGWWWWNRRLERLQDGPVLAAAVRYGVHPALVKAVVWRESRFHPKAQGKAGEIGLMQVTDLAAREWADAERLGNYAPEHLFDPATNTLAGTWYLRKLLGRYRQTDDPVPYALADYNAGRSNVLRWNKGAAATNSAAFLAQMDFPGTRQYVESVMQRFAHYRPIFPPPAVKE